MSKLAECNPEDCHRGVEFDSRTDGDGNTHRKVRVKCLHCGVEGSWHEDDSLTRAIDDWNGSHVGKASEVTANRKSEEANTKAQNKKRAITALEQSLASCGPEIAFAELKESELRKVGKGDAADYFKSQVATLREHQVRVSAELESLKAEKD